MFYSGGDGLKTLFVYCSEDDTINSLCRESAFKKSEAESLQLSSCSGKTLFSRYLDAVRSRSSVITKDYAVDFNDYDRIIIACDEFAGEVSPEMSVFIKSNDFRYKNVDCIVFGDGRGALRAKDGLKVRISLSGGTVRNCVSVSTKKLKKEEEDLLFSIRHRLAI